MDKGIYSNLRTNVSYEVPTKCCYFLSRSEIQYGRPGLWLADTVSTSSQSTENLAQMYITGSWPSVVTYYVDQKYIMATLALMGW